MASTMGETGESDSRPPKPNSIHTNFLGGFDTHHLPSINTSLPAGRKWREEEKEMRCLIR
jgi:hypothetical protein